MRRPILLIALTFAAIAPPALAGAAAGKDAPALAKGSLIVTFSGSGAGTYRFHQSVLGGAGFLCRQAETTFSGTDSYSWSYTFVVPPAGGRSDTPMQLAGGGALTAAEQLGRCAGVPVTTSTCLQRLRVPPASNAGDLAYPGVSVVSSGRIVTVGVLGELIRAGQASCSGGGSLQPNRVQGYSGLQASVSFPRALLNRTGDVKAPFTMANAGLYDGVELSGSCASSTCDAATCTQDLPGGGGGPPNSCNFTESYSGTIEVRVVR